MPSLESKLLVLFLRATRRKRPYTDPRVLRARIELERRTIDHAPPTALSSRCTVERHETEGAPSYTLSPRGPSSGRHVLYLHGGCYVFEVSPHHWRFCASLVKTLGCTVTVPIYPLAPEHGVDDALRMVTAAYRKVAASVDPKQIAIMGDSAGGGMALALAQLLDKHALPQPKDIVLLSPWLDVAMENPDIPTVDARDPWLSRAGLVEAGRLYRGNIDPKDPRVSPIHGELYNLGAISIFIGTRDVLLPDARRLRDLAKKIGATVNMYEYDAMVHDFMLVAFLPEAKRALGDIEGVLRLA